MADGKFEDSWWLWGEIKKINFLSWTIQRDIKSNKEK